MNNKFKSINEAYQTVSKEYPINEITTSYNALGVESFTSDIPSGTLEELLKIQKLLLNSPAEAKKSVDMLINKLKGSTSDVNDSSKTSFPQPKDYFK